MGLTLTQKLSITLSLLCTMNHNKIVILPVTLVELSSYSLYIHTIYLPVGEDCTRAGARAPMLKTKVRIDISEFKFQLGPRNDSPCHGYHKPRFLLDSHDPKTLMLHQGVSIYCRCVLYSTTDKK